MYAGLRDLFATRPDVAGRGRRPARFSPGSTRRIGRRDRRVNPAPIVPLGGINLVRPPVCWRAHTGIVEFRDHSTRTYREVTPATIQPVLFSMGVRDRVLPSNVTRSRAKPPGTCASGSFATNAWRVR